jgi:prepilin-type N-terminal cleavage/methylation domain-containing protein
MSRTRRSKGGFTLIEVIVAVTILTFIVGIAYRSITQMLTTKTIIEDERAGRRVAQAFFSRFIREVQLVYDQAGLLPERSDADGQVSPSRINLIGEPGEDGKYGRFDRIRFLAAEGGQYLPDGGRHSGVVQLEYRVERDPEERDEADRRVLVRDEVPYIFPIKTAFGQSMIFPITDRIVRFQLRYFDPNNESWSDDWGKEGRVKLPGMLEISLGIMTPRGDIQSFRTVVSLTRGEAE